jgi:hypothetical protein
MQPQSDETTAPVKSGVLHFNSVDDLSSTISQMKERQAFDIKHLPATRAAAQALNGEFVSLRQHLLDQGLREFTDVELAEIAADSLEYEPEDSLIVDPYMTAILNGEREVQVGDKICRFVEDGMMMYDANEKVLFDPNLVEQKLAVESMSHGQVVEIADTKGVKAQFVKVDYIKEDLILQDRVIIDGGNSGGGGFSSVGSGNSGNNSSVTYNYDGSITLTNGMKIPKDRIRRATYTKGGGNGSWLAQGLSGWFGLNVTITNNYNKRHRMKLRMYEQDYIIYRAVGMTVRMQKRTLGIWWRKKAQEFRYGWSAIECEYKFPSPTFIDPPKMPNGLPQYNKYPTGMTKKFPFANSKIVLFHIPLANYDVTTGDVNGAMAAGMKKLASSINSWFNDSQNKGLLNNPRGLFTTRDGDRKIRVIFPQSEEVDYHTGREVVRWDKQWFSGNFMIGFKSNMSGGGFHYKNSSFSPAKDVSIIRGRIYGAVKYDNQWRACVIETK